MENLYNRIKCYSSSSPDEQDDFSLFLHQIMLQSCSPSSSSFMAQKGNEVQSIRPNCGLQGNQDCGHQLVSGTDWIPIPEASFSAGQQHWFSSGDLASPLPGACFQQSGVNVSSSSVSVGAVDNDLNDYDCESEGFEGAVEEATVKPTAVRSASKRSRAAEVHNLSEKRRRSRINEKMKALQKLIPNSNKTDKASMLDEAIEYLKQLQLQVQLLTMRNGLSLYPICLPGVLQSNQLPDTRMGFKGQKSMNTSLASALLPNSSGPNNVLFNLPDNYDNAKQASVVNISKLNDSEHAFAPESVIHVHHGPIQFALPGSSKKVPSQQDIQDLSRTKSEENIGAEAHGLMTFNALASGLEDNTLEACVLGRDKSGGKLLTSLDCKTPLLLQVDGNQTGRSTLVDDSTKAERPDL